MDCVPHPEHAPQLLHPVHPPLQLSPPVYVPLQVCRPAPAWHVQVPFATLHVAVQAWVDVVLLVLVQVFVQHTGAALSPAHVQPAGHAEHELPAPVPFR